MQSASINQSTNPLSIASTSGTWARPQAGVPRGLAHRNAAGSAPQTRACCRSGPASATSQSALLAAFAAGVACGAGARCPGAAATYQPGGEPGDTVGASAAGACGAGSASLPKRCRDSSSVWVNPSAVVTFGASRSRAGPRRAVATAAAASAGGTDGVGGPAAKKHARAESTKHSAAAAEPAAPTAPAAASGTADAAATQAAAPAAPAGSAAGAGAGAGAGANAAAEQESQHQQPTSQQQPSQQPTSQQPTSQQQQQQQQVQSEYVEEYETVYVTESEVPEAGRAAAAAAAAVGPTEAVAAAGGGWAGAGAGSQQRLLHQVRAEWDGVGWKGFANNAG